MKTISGLEYIELEAGTGAQAEAKISIYQIRRK